MYVQLPVKLALKLILFSSLGLILSLAVGNSHAYGGASAIRIIQALVDVPAADFYLDEKPMGAVEYGKAAPYLQLEAGEHTLKVYVAGQNVDDTPLYERGFTLQADTHINLVMFGTSTEPRMEIYAIDRTPSGDHYGVSHVNVIHAVAGGSDPVTVTAAANDPASTPLLTAELAFGENQPLDLPAGNYRLNGEGLLKDIPLNIDGDMSFAVVMIGAADGSQPVEIRVFTNSTLDDEPTSHPRFVHAIPEGPAVDLYLNDVMASGNLFFGRTSVYFGLKPGTYTAELYPAGSDPARATPLLSSELELTADQYQTIVIMNNADHLALAVVNDDMSVPPQTSSGVAIINATANPLDLAVDGAATMNRLPVGAISARVTLAEGVHSLNFNNGAALAVATLDNFSVNPVTIANLKTLIVTEKDIIVLTDCPVFS